MNVRKSSHPEAIREAAQVAYRMGADVVLTALAGIQSKENHLNAKAIDAEFRVIEDPKGLLTDGISTKMGR